MTVGLIHGALALNQKYGMPQGEFFKAVGLGRNFGNRRVKKAAQRDSADPLPRTNQRKRKLAGRGEEVADVGWHEMCYDNQKRISTISRTFGPQWWRWGCNEFE